MADKTIVKTSPNQPHPGKRIPAEEMGCIHKNKPIGGKMKKTIIKMVRIKACKQFNCLLKNISHIKEKSTVTKNN